MYDVMIVGAGPAGASAALFTAKAGKKTLVIDSGKSLTKRAWVENHYGVKEITGPELLDLGKEQAAKFGAEIVQAQALDVSKTEEGFQVAYEGGTAAAKHVILATGLGLDLAEKLGVQTKPGTEPRIQTVIAADAEGKTNVDGVWAAGTVAGVSVHTIITAGHGAAVAINVISALNGARYVDHDVLKG
ncbi:FAD-dependent oxidoreductase [Ectobacillus ponti]|uniref:FAD-dependent oxidoreductase n=1 Tax=Ectobacillus ponti TaxID=2961894 RepID=A0AA41XBI2_9BACI|nr:FAD-dependent oxidoreductase [Ectobacillus ponti]MCP8970430.1 FAD-dependent oxidoreductase [Ectobacillus ponti]